LLLDQDSSSSEEEEEDDGKSVGSFASISSAASSASARVRLMLNSALPSNMSRSDAEKKLRSESEYKTPREPVPVKPHQKGAKAKEWRKGRNMGIGNGYREPMQGASKESAGKDERCERSECRKRCLVIVLCSIVYGRRIAYCIRSTHRLSISPHR